MMLSDHFSTDEFRCSCGCGFGTELDDVSPALLGGLEALRLALGTPIYINSGCRCAAHNHVIGGVRNSQHLRGCAADIRVDVRTPKQVEAVALIVPCFRDGGIGTYRTFVHLDTRGHKARWEG